MTRAARRMVKHSLGEGRKRIIYHCYGGSHSSVTAASIHLGILPQDRVPTRAELESLPYFDRQTRMDHGKIRFIGVDHEGNYVYIMGRRNFARVVINALRSIAEIMGIDNHQVIFVDVMPAVNLSMMLGGTMSRAMGLIGLGRPIVVFGTQRAYYRLLALVERVKASLKSANR